MGQYLEIWGESVKVLSWKQQEFPTQNNKGSDVTLNLHNCIRFINIGVQNE